MVSRALLPGEHVVLAILGVRPMHGYEMARYIESQGIGEVCQIEQSLLYTYVRNVEERELVSWSEQRVGLRPPRKIFELTEAGRETVDAWLRKPVSRMREVRLELLLKLFFLDVIDRRSVGILLAEQIAVCETYLANVRSRPSESPFGRLIAQSKSSAAESTLGWLRTYARELEKDVVP